MTKSALRKKYKALRQELPLEKIEAYSIDIANQLLSLYIWDYNYYHIFLPIEEKNEINTEFILNILNGKDKHIVISKSNFETLSMTNYLLTDNTKIKKNQYNIPEPTNGLEVDNYLLDVVFVPLLAFDNYGNRVGYGKGFYDRFLSQCRPDTIKIGLSFFDAEVKISDADAKDITLDFCVTPRQVYQF